VTLRRRPRDGDRLDAGGIKWCASVGGRQRRTVELQHQSSGHPSPGRRVGGVLGELDNDAVAVANEGEVVLKIGIGSESRW
jgi:hypothetical protein